MRAGLLSQPVVINALNQSFVCTWALPSAVEELRDNGTSSEKKAAAALLDSYGELVEMIILSPEGELVDHRNMNEHILKAFPHPWSPDKKLVQYFLTFLSDSAKSVLSKSEAH